MRCGFDFRLLPLDIFVTGECEIKHFSSPLNTTKQGATLASMKHQTLGKNLKLTGEVPTQKNCSL
jgi:hypothetical protein